MRDAGGSTRRLERASWVAALNGLARSFQDVDTDELTGNLKRGSLGCWHSADYGHRGR